MKDKYNLTKEQNIFLAKKELVSNIYNSVKLEGINTTYPDTKSILEGANVSILKIDDITCILNLRDAWNFVLKNIDAEINLEFICNVNSYVSRNESLEWGTLRKGKVGISGVDYIPKVPIEDEVVININDILDNSNATYRALKLMLYLMRSQPFWDENEPLVKNATYPQNAYKLGFSN